MLRAARLRNSPDPRQAVANNRLPYVHIIDMDRRMKTTLNIDDTVMAALRREAARQGRTMSELVETALRLLLQSQRKPRDLPSLPRFHSGGALVDLADRNALYEAMEGRP
jgi:plasmid stability protein